VVVPTGFEPVFKP